MELSFVMEIKPTRRISPLADVSPTWEYDSSDYPDLIRVAMDNGHVVTYRREIAQPGFTNVMELLGRLPVTEGYAGKHEKNRSL
jgi:hypothetical protein